MFSKMILTLFFSSLAVVSASGTIQSRQSITLPTECDVIPTWEMTNFRWFNSSSNLDCVTEVDVPNVCFNSTSTGLVACDSNLTPCDECGVQGCSTGLPLQPAGYGPPDSISLSINVSGYTSCSETNPQSIRRYEVGDGTLMCSGVAYRVGFYGDSNQEVTTGHLDFAPITTYACTNGSTIRGSGSVDFEVDCTRDLANNATCVVKGGDAVVIPLLDYTID